jgi:hypothetical protein
MRWLTFDTQELLIIRDGEVMAYSNYVLRVFSGDASIAKRAKIENVFT